MMTPADIRVALYSGNYNYVRDGANQALNRLVEYLLRQGAAVRVYSATAEVPAFEPAGDLVSVPSVAFPGRGEYRFPLWLGDEVKRDLAEFRPNIMHLSSPDFAARRALKWAKRQGLPVLGSVHTRFETYPRYYGLGFLEPFVLWLVKGVYSHCDALVAPSPKVIEELHAQGMNDNISLWSRGVDRTIFHPSSRDLVWRRSLGIADDEIVVGFLGRLVLEKGLDLFGEAITELRRRGVPHKVLVVGDGPAKSTFAELVPDACFVGFQTGHDLGRSVASMDMLLNPSVTETFGNVTLEAMACGLPVVAADATGANSLLHDGENGYLVPPRDAAAYADRMQAYIENPQLRLAHGAAGARFADAFEWDAINSVVAEAYLRLLENQKSA